MRGYESTSQWPGVGLPVDEAPTPNQSSGTVGSTGHRVADVNFFRGEHLLHGVIKADHRASGAKLERKLRKLGMEFNFAGRGQTGAVAIHATPWASHLHWLHQCGCFHGDCKCAQTRQLRHRGYSIKWQRVGLINREHERNLFLYLQKQGRSPLQAFCQGEDRMEEFLQAQRNAHKEGGGRTKDLLQCELDDQQNDGSSDGESSGDDASVVSGAGSYTQGKKIAQTRKASDLKLLAKELWQIMERKLPSGLMKLTQDPEYMQLMEPLYYVDDVARLRITNQVWENFLITWNRKSVMDIIIHRSNNLSTFNLRNYYSLKYSLYVVVRLLGEQETAPWEFLSNFLDIINLALPKRNTFTIYGSANCGKTYFINTIGDLLWSTGEVEANINRTNNFPFADLLNKRLAVLNEFNCSPARKDTCKAIFEGLSTKVAVKYKNEQDLGRIPIIITTNNNWLQNFDKVDADAFRSRGFFTRWHPKPWLKEENGYPHPLVWAKLMTLTDEASWLATYSDLLANPPMKEFQFISNPVPFNPEILQKINSTLFA